MALPLAVVAPAVGYVCAALLLILPFGNHPNFPYNWEDYTLTRVFDFWDHPGLWILNIDGGLMTDSGQSPLLAIPVWLAWKIDGVGLTALRLPLMLISAAAAPLLWLLGRHVAGPLEGGLAATLLALSPVFLFYGRTATNVALSLVPAVLTIYVLLGLLRQPDSKRRIATLQALLLLGVYAYAPIRLLWLMALALLALEMILQPHARRALAIALAVTAVTIPLFLVTATGKSPVRALELYYWGRGEHLLALREYPDNLRSHMVEEIAENPELASASTDELVRHKFVRNLRDLGNLLIDRNTRPALTDYWNPRGRLYPRALLPLLLTGLAICAARAVRSADYRAILVVTTGFILPMVLTSNVHIGRLIFALPLLMLIASIGFVWAARKLLSLCARALHGQVLIWGAVPQQLPTSPDGGDAMHGLVKPRDGPHEGIKSVLAGPIFSSGARSPPAARWHSSSVGLPGVSTAATPRHPGPGSGQRHWRTARQISASLPAARHLSRIATPRLKRSRLRPCGWRSTVTSRSLTSASTHWSPAARTRLRCTTGSFLLQAAS